MRRIGSSCPEPLHGAEATRAIEQALASTLPPFELMSRAGARVAQLACAIAPHARKIWVACGPGNNGGDGMVAARLLHIARQHNASAAEVVVTLCAADPCRLPKDAAQALAQALEAGIVLAETPPGDADLVIDALLGIGVRDGLHGPIATQLGQIRTADCPVLAVDVPSGLMADTGNSLSPTAAPPTKAQRHTLTFLTLKPGLFTADGRDLAGSVWFDPLTEDGSQTQRPPDARLFGRQDGAGMARPHAAHKGSQGDVVVIGGQDISCNGEGMTGAAVLAARAALHAGAGRVYTGLLGHPDAVRWDPLCPELMFRAPEALTQSVDLMANATVVCGCGGEQRLRPCSPLCCQTAVLWSWTPTPSTGFPKIRCCRPCWVCAARAAPIR